MNSNNICHLLSVGDTMSIPSAASVAVERRGPMTRSRNISSPVLPDGFRQNAVTPLNPIDSDDGDRDVIDHHLEEVQREVLRNPLVRNT